MSNRRLKRREFLKGLAAAAGGTVLAACAPQVVKETVVVEKPVERKVIETVVVEKAVEQRVVETVVVEKVVTQAPAAPEAPTEVRFGHWWGEKFDKIIPLAEEGYNMKINNEPVGWGEYWAKLPAQLAAGTAADLVMMDDQVQYMFVKEGTLLPWDPFLEMEGVDLDEWAIDLRLEGGWKDGKIYTLGLAFTLSMCLWINMELAEETGIEPPIWGSDSFDDWGYDDWLEFWQAGTKRTSDGTIEQIGLSTNPLSWGAYGGVYQWFKAWDAEWIDDHFWNDTEFIGNSAINVEVCEKTWDLTAKHKVCPDAAESQLVQGGYWRARKALCEWYFTVSHGFTEMQAEGIVEVAHMPREVCRQFPVGPNSWCVPNSAANTRGGQTLGLALTGHDKNIGMLSAAIDELPAANAVFYRENFTGFANRLFNVQTSRYESISNYAPSTVDACIAPWMMGAKAPKEWPSHMGTEMGKARLGQIGWQEAMDNTKKLVDPLLQKPL